MRSILVLMVLTTALFALRSSFLMPEEAFIPKASLQNGSTVVIDIELGKEIYLYEEELKVIDTDTNDEIVIQSVSMPEAVEHHEEMVFLESPHIELPLAKTADFSGSKEFTVKLSFQGCSEKGLCYEPIEKLYSFTVESSALAMNGAAAQSEEAAAEPKAAPLVSETSEIASIIKESGLGVIILTFFGFGLLLALTPCVFPMVPILSSVIVAQGEGITAKRAFWLSVVYVLAMSITYTVAGILAGLFGGNLQAAFQTPWVIGLFSGLFVVLALSMFDLFEFQMPNFIQSRLSDVGSHQKGVAGVATMGFLSALIVGPCVAAPLAGALIYIGQSGDALIGGVALFALSIGMGLPLLLVGTAAGRYMPKPGAWMDTIKHIFGFLMLAVAIWMASRVLSAQMTLLAWSVLLVFAAVGTGAFEQIRGRCIRCWRAARKSVGILMFMYAAALFIGALTGATNPLNPLEKFSVSAASQTVSEQKTVFKTVRSMDELNSVLADSKGKKVLVDFWAQWCTSCDEMERNTFSNPAVQNAMKDFVLVKADITANDDASKALTKNFGIQGPPTVIFFDETGTLIEGAEIVGEKGPEAFLKLLERF